MIKYYFQFGVFGLSQCSKQFGKPETAQIVFTYKVYEIGRITSRFHINSCLIVQIYTLFPNKESKIASLTLFMTVSECLKRRLEMLLFVSTLAKRRKNFLKRRKNFFFRRFIFVNRRSGKQTSSFWSVDGCFHGLRR